MQAIKNISLNASTHREIFKNDNLGVLLVMLQKIDKFCDDSDRMGKNGQDKFVKFDKKKGT